MPNIKVKDHLLKQYCPDRHILNRLLYTMSQTTIEVGNYHYGCSTVQKTATA